MGRDHRLVSHQPTVIHSECAGLGEIADGTATLTVAEA